MSNFANTLVELLLSIMRVLVSAVTGLLKGWQSSGFLGWMMEHWKGIVIMLLIIGVAADMLVWVFRWQPYYVWSRKLRRVFNWARRQGKAMKDPSYRDLPEEAQEQNRAEILQRLGQTPAGRREVTFQRPPHPDAQGVEAEPRRISFTRQNDEEPGARP